MSGAITWCRGLMDRILGPMNKLEQLSSTNKGILDREEAKEVKKSICKCHGII
jgi:dynein heavy chain